MVSPLPAPDRVGRGGSDARAVSWPTALRRGIEWNLALKIIPYQLVKYVSPTFSHHGGIDSSFAMQRGRIPSDSKIPSSASRRLCGRIWVVGDGAFAPEVWLPSARRPYPVFFDSRGFASFAGLLQKGRGLPLLQSSPLCVTVPL